MVMLSGLQTSLSGMKVAQNQMDIVGRNLANIDTVGYTRKTAAQKNLVLGGYSAGVQLGDITRTVNEGLLKSYLASNSQTGNLNAKNQFLGKTETLLGTPSGNNSIAANVGDLQSAFETFASDVTSSSGRYNLLNNANTVASHHIGNAAPAVGKTQSGQQSRCRNLLALGVKNCQSDIAVGNLNILIGRVNKGPAAGEFRRRVRIRRSAVVNLIDGVFHCGRQFVQLGLQRGQLVVANVNQPLEFAVFNIIGDVFAVNINAADAAAGNQSASL